jgi:hypothetical protein
MRVNTDKNQLNYLRLSAANYDINEFKLPGIARITYNLAVIGREAAICNLPMRGTNL